MKRVRPAWKSKESSAPRLKRDAQKPKRGGRPKLNWRGCGRRSNACARKSNTAYACHHSWKDGALPLFNASMFDLRPGGLKIEFRAHLHRMARDAQRLRVADAAITF